MPRRRRKSGFSAFLDNFSPTKLLLHPASLFLLLNIFLAMTAVYFWNRYQDRIVDPASTVLTAEKIEINTPPAWTKTDLRAAILGPTDVPKSLLDPGLISDAVATCQSVGWIEEVRRMEKTREGLKVDLVYREPIALVELGGQTVPGWKDKPRLVPVDRKGVIMPESLVMGSNVQPKIFIFHSDETQQHAPQYLRHINRWTEWPDSRVRDAAAISELLVARWQAFGLSRIISWRLISDADNATIPYELWTDEGENAATVVWGNAPGSELNGEASWDQKVAALIGYVEKSGPLDKLGGRVIDLRSGQAIEVGRSAALGYRRSIESDGFQVR
jgi:hypothetical protein